MTVAVGLVHLLTAGSYLFLTLLAVAEQRRTRVTRFSAALTVMFLGCGLHHAVHAEHALVFGVGGSPLVLAALVVAALPSTVFLALRLEALGDGRGDRLISGTPAWLVLAPAAAVLGSGVLLALAVGPAIRDGVDAPGLVANLVLLVTYGTVGWYLRDTQVKRRPLRGGWSLSGVSLAAIFPLCAFAHVVNALTVPADIHAYLIEGVQVPGSLFFLWAVRDLHRRAVRELNRRPAVGRASRTSRPSPWTRPAGAA